MVHRVFKANVYSTDTMALFNNGVTFDMIQFLSLHYA